MSNTVFTLSLAVFVSHLLAPFAAEQTLSQQHLKRSASDVYMPTKLKIATSLGHQPAYNSMRIDRAAVQALYGGASACLVRVVAADVERKL